MLISENVLEEALAQVFDGKSTGANMELEEITAAWAKTGLRKSDLRDALRQMVEAHGLIPYSHQGNLAFLLTEQGALRFDICRHRGTGLQAWLASRRELQDEYLPLDAFSATWNRRAVRH